KKQKTTRRTLWGTNGPNDFVSSLSVLLDWLTEEGNDNKWRRGDKQNGDTKTSLAKAIAERIRDNGITHPRKAKDIVTKIGLLEQSFRIASDFLANTGAGITNEASLQAAIEVRCPHYDLLKDIMGDRASIRPLLTTDDEDYEEVGDNHGEADTDSISLLTAHRQESSRVVRASRFDRRVHVQPMRRQLGTTSTLRTPR
ncbi:hypothetical protein PHMEG_00024659, partial [Phytophthora megakarya]